MSSHDYNDFFVVLEQTSPEGMKIEIISDKCKNNLNYLKFRSCIQSFGERNRNRRLWPADAIRKSLFGPECQELLKNGFPGENGHPIPATGQATMERIVTIDPNNISHLLSNFAFTDDNRLLYADVETIDDIDGPGAKFARNIMQGMIPSFSCRAIVPQRKNKDGTIDVTGPGRLVTYDRVILPSHKEAYMDINIPVKQICKEVAFESVMESAVGYIIDKSEKANRILDELDPVFESALADLDGSLIVDTNEIGRVIIPTEKRISNEISRYMRKF